MVLLVFVVVVLVAAVVVSVVGSGSCRVSCLFHFRLRVIRHSHVVSCMSARTMLSAFAQFWTTPLKVCATDLRCSSFYSVPKTLHGVRSISDRLTATFSKTLSFLRRLCNSPLRNFEFFSRKQHEPRKTCLTKHLRQLHNLKSFTLAPICRFPQNLN